MKWIMAMAAVMAVPAMALGAASFSLSVGGATAIEVNPADDPATFALDLFIDQDDANGTAGFGGALEASTNGVFYVTSKAMQLDGPFFLLTLGPVFKNDTNKWLSPRTANFGAMSSSANGYWNAGQFPGKAVTIGMAVPAGAPNGVYTISIGDPGGGIYISNYDGEGSQTPLTTSSLQVTVVPEPASMLLLVGALPFLRRRRSA